MIQIKLFTQKSILVVLLVSNTVNPLLAFTGKEHPVIKRNQQVHSIFDKVKNVLVDKGLNEDAAIKKTIQLLHVENNRMKKLELLYSSSSFFLEKQKLIDTLAKYALYEKKLDLNSYSSLLGLAQSILSRPLNQNELTYIQQTINV